MHPLLLRREQTLLSGKRGRGDEGFPRQAVQEAWTQTGGMHGLGREGIFGQWVRQWLDFMGKEENASLGNFAVDMEISLKIALC